ncbi:unnamed protein product [Choristocarpus tenellus]
MPSSSGRRYALFATLALIMGNGAKGFGVRVGGHSATSTQSWSNRWVSRTATRTSTSTFMAGTALELDNLPYADIIPFLREHVQPPDQILIYGCGTDIPLQLSRDGYGTVRGGNIRCVDYDAARIDTLKAAAEADPVCAQNVANGKLRFELLDLSGDIPQLTQSCADSIVDCGLLDDVVTTQGAEVADRCVEAAHRAVILGNPLVALSRIDRTKFSALFDGKLGWMQELDGDPGALCQWYRKQKINLKAVDNNFAALGIFFFVYTNVDNC